MPEEINRKVVDHLSDVNITYSENSKNYKEKLDTKIASLIEYSSSFPLEKKTDSYVNIIKPIISARYSPNNSKKARDDDRRINFNNVFSLNRLGLNDSVEGGGSLSFGTEYNKTDLTGRDVFTGKIANVFKYEEDKNLPINSSLGNKTSDIMGYLNYNPNNFYNIEYEFSQDENLKDTNYQLLKNKLEKEGLFDEINKKVNKRSKKKWFHHQITQSTYAQISSQKKNKMIKMNCTKS